MLNVVDGLFLADLDFLRAAMLPEIRIDVV
jgi:hypothetical protein